MMQHACLSIRRSCLKRILWLFRTCYATWDCNNVGGAITCSRISFPGLRLLAPRHVHERVQPAPRQLQPRVGLPQEDVRQAHRPGRLHRQAGQGAARLQGEDWGVKRIMSIGMHMIDGNYRCVWCTSLYHKYYAALTIMIMLYKLDYPFFMGHWAFFKTNWLFPASSER